MKGLKADSFPILGNHFCILGKKKYEKFFSIKFLKKYVAEMNILGLTLFIKVFSIQQNIV